MTTPSPATVAPPKVLQFLDFNPKITDRTTLEGRTKYEKFSALIDRVNKWLAKNLIYQLISVESVQISLGEPIPEVPIYRGPNAPRTLATYPVTIRTPCNYLRGVRIWVRHYPGRTSTSLQTVRYLTVVPNLRVELDAKSGRAEYAIVPADQLFTAANEYMALGKLRGKFLCAEIFSLYLSADRINPEMCAWSVTGAASQQYVEVLRIFYEMSQTDLLEPTLAYVDLFPHSFSNEADELLGVRKPPTEGVSLVGDASTIFEKTSSKSAAADLLLATSHGWQKNHPECQILRSQTYPRRGDTFLAAATSVWPRVIDDVVQEALGLRLIYYTPRSSRPSVFIRKSELFVPKINFDVSFLGNCVIRHESQAKMLERIAEWASYSQYKDGSFAVCNAETVLYSVPVGLSTSPLCFLRRWWRQWHDLPAESVSLKCCRVHFTVAEKQK